MTRDIEAAKAFYAASQVGTYEPMDAGGQPVPAVPGGGPDGLRDDVDAGEDMPAGAPSHWMVYFGVSDTDASARSGRARSAATIVAEPFDTPVGRSADAAGLDRGHLLDHLAHRGDRPERGLADD